MAKNTHMLNIVLEFWRPKCTNKYVYEQFIEIKIVQTLNDTLLQVVLWLMTYSNKTTRFQLYFYPPYRRPRSCARWLKNSPFSTNLCSCMRDYGFQSELPGREIQRFCKVIMACRIYIHRGSQSSGEEMSCYNSQ